MKKDVLTKLENLEKELGRRPIKRDNSSLYFLARKHFGSWNNLLNAAGHRIKNKQETKVPKKFSKHFYYFLGLLITDGHIQYVSKGGKYRTIIFTSNTDEKEMIIELIKELFSYTPSVRSKKYGFNKKENHEIYISSKKLCDFLIKKVGIPSGAKSLTIEIPSFIKKKGVREKWAFIRGVFDGDGSIINTKKANAFKVASGSEMFIKDLDDLFISLGFDSGKIRKERENLWLFKINKIKNIEKIHRMIYNDTNKYFYPRKKKKWKHNI